MQECASAAERNCALCGAWAPHFLAMLALGQAQLEAHLALAQQVSRQCLWCEWCSLCHMVHGSLWLTHEAMHEPWSGKQGRKPQTGSQDPMTHDCAPFGSLTRLLVSGSEACLCERHLQTCMGFCPWAVCLPDNETVSCQGYNTKPHSAIWSPQLSCVPHRQRRP